MTRAAKPRARKPQRERLPDARHAKTLHVEMHTANGNLDVYATLGYYPDGRPGELFLRLRGEHADLYAGLADAFAIAVSLALQHGVPLSAIGDKLRGSRGEPCGRVGKALNASLLDELAKWFETFAEEQP